MTEVYRLLADSRQAHKTGKDAKDRKLVDVAQSAFTIALEKRLKARELDPKRTDSAWLSDLANLHAGVRWLEDPSPALLEQFDRDIETYLRRQLGEDANTHAQVDLKDPSVVHVPRAWRETKSGKIKGCRHSWKGDAKLRRCIACKAVQEFQPTMAPEASVAFQQARKETAKRGRG